MGWEDGDVPQPVRANQKHREIIFRKIKSLNENGPNFSNEISVETLPMETCAHRHPPLPCPVIYYYRDFFCHSVRDTVLIYHYYKRNYINASRDLQ